ncbi:MAG: MBL fold metallo-hydrolase [Proteobacteria bacterium]|nr:MBL fold metallo-hydrolase [Pseudomonadota bacterium]
MKKINPYGTVSLKNEGELELFFLGTGSAFTKTLNQTNFLIIKGDAHILVDFGMTGPKALHQTTGLELIDIDVILPTHSHADHTGGIEALALMNRYVGIRHLGKSKIKMIVTEDYQDILWSQSLRGGLAPNEIGPHPSGELQFLDFFDAIRPELKSDLPRETFVLDFEGIHLELFRTHHFPEQAESWKTAALSYGLFIDDRIFFSGDTQFDPDLIDQYAEKSEFMLHDVQFFNGGVHPSLEDLKTLPAEIKKKMHLMHYNDEWANYDISDFAGWWEQGARYIF